MSNENLAQLDSSLDADFSAMQESDHVEEVAEVVEKAVEEVVETPEPANEPVQNETVPLATFLETKNDLKSTKGQIADLQAQLDALANPPEVVEEISIEDDPVGHLEQKNKLTEDRIEQLGEEMKIANQQQQQSAIQSQVTNLEQQFAAQTDDYYDSVAHLQQTRVEHYKIMGADEAQALAAVNNELISVAKTAIQNGKNPAEVVYQLSKSTGFAKQGERQGDASLKALAKAQDSSGTLANIPGQTGSDNENVISANNLSDKDFDDKFLGNDADFKALFN